MDDELEVAIRKLLFALADDVPAADDDRTPLDAASQAIEQVHHISDELAAKQSRIKQLEARVESLENVVNAESKSGKVQRIIDYAKNQAEDGQRAVVVTAKEIRGVTGVSRRYAYDIIDEWPDDYGFFVARKNLTQYGDLEREDREDRGRGLVVILDGSVHSNVVSVNQFTTRSRSEGGEA